MLLFITFDMYILMLLQAKADEIAKFINENEQLKSVIEDLKVGVNYSLFFLISATNLPIDACLSLPFP